jgi:hypothetical protein
MLHLHILTFFVVMVAITVSDGFVTPSRISILSPLRLYLKPEYLASDEGEERFDGNVTLVTKESFLRRQLEDPVVKRKGKDKKNTKYRVLDNRDSLPFAIEMTTPDPYTHPDFKKKNAKKNKVVSRKDTIEGIASSLYMNQDGSDVDFKTKLGEFVLDKHTTTGDLLEIGDAQYKVVRHKCQYKYAGGRRFVMVRKILQVKEVGRLQAEEYLERTWGKYELPET